MDAIDVAGRLGVDPKTVQRWMAGRIPYPRHRAALVELTGWTAHDLWPATSALEDRERPPDEVRCVYPQRSAVSTDAWRRLFGQAKSEIGVLAYSGLFLAEDVATQQVLRDRASAGVRVRIVLGDRDGRHVAARDAAEGLDGAMQARIRNVLVLYRQLVDWPGIHLRLHDTVLYNSIYWADDEVMVNTHVHGCPASHAPVFHLRRAQRDGMAVTYLASFERVWATACPTGGGSIR